MNIFVLDADPYKSANMLIKRDPKRARKMVVEVTQAVGYLMHKHDVSMKYRPRKSDGKIYKTDMASRFPKKLLRWLENSLNLQWMEECAYQIAYKLGMSEQVKGNIDNMRGLIYKLQRTILFCNYAKSKTKGLDFTHINNVCEAYDQYLSAQGV